jgi:hypothetical protein
VVESVIFFMYTKIVLDVSRYNNDDDAIDALSAEQVAAPLFSCDFMDPYMLADFLVIAKLTELLLHNCISTERLFSPFSSSMATKVEEMLACMLVRALHSTTAASLSFAFSTQSKWNLNLCTLIGYPLFLQRV